MSGAGPVAALVLLEWTVGWIGAAAWTQSWSVVRRGHFRITAWGAVTLAGLATLTYRSGSPGRGSALVTAVFVMAVLYLVVQYARTDLPGAWVGGASGVVGLVALGVTGGVVSGWPAPLAAAQLASGAALLGSVTNGMMLGHWYLNQPGLKPWALGRLTALALAAVAAAGALGLAAGGTLTQASTDGARIGVPGVGDGFGVVVYLVWAALLVFTGVVVWGARRCVVIRSIQSATGLYYVAILTAGVAEFMVRYLMVNAV